MSLFHEHLPRGLDEPRCLNPATYLTYDWKNSSERFPPSKRFISHQRWINNQCIFGHSQEFLSSSSPSPPFFFFFKCVGPNWNEIYSYTAGGDSIGHIILKWLIRFWDRGEGGIPVIVCCHPRQHLINSNDNLSIYEGDFPIDKRLVKQNTYFYLSSAVFEY